MNPTTFAFLTPRLYRRIGAALLAGLLASVPMALCLMIGFSYLGQAAVRPLRLIAAMLLGEAALLPSMIWVSVLVGLAVHLALGALFGGFFGMMTLTRRPVRLALQGLAYGLAVWVVMQFVILPLGTNLPLVSRMPPALYGIAHAVYGLSLCSLLGFERNLVRQDLEEERERAENVLPAA